MVLNENHRFFKYFFIKIQNLISLQNYEISVFYIFPKKKSNQNLIISFKKIDKKCRKHVFKFCVNDYKQD